MSLCNKNYKLCTIYFLKTAKTGHNSVLVQRIRLHAVGNYPKMQEGTVMATTSGRLYLCGCALDLDTIILYSMFA